MPPQNKPSTEYIRTMFDHLAPRYDLFNHLTSMGMATGWRKKALEPVKPGMRVLDLGCGTGDLCLEAVQKIDGCGEVIGLDFSPVMLEFAQQRWDRVPLSQKIKNQGTAGPGPLRFELRKAEELPIEPEPYDLVLSGFVLRNLYENIDQILKGVYKSLKVGGQISFLDITKTPNPLINNFWKVYMNSVVALYGKILFGKHYPILYLTQSAERFLEAREFIQKLEAVGFKEIRTKKFLLGAVTLYRTVK